MREIKPTPIMATFRPMAELLASDRDRAALVLTKKGVWSAVEFSPDWTCNTLYGHVDGAQAMDGGGDYPNILSVAVVDCVGWIDAAEFAETVSGALTAAPAVTP
jgi:hypothetical protein